MKLFKFLCAKDFTILSWLILVFIPPSKNEYNLFDVAFLKRRIVLKIYTGEIPNLNTHNDLEHQDLPSLIFLLIHIFHF